VAGGEANGAVGGGANTAQPGSILISAPSAVTLPLTVIPARGVIYQEVSMAERPEEELTADELLVEEVSIDGLCGVY
jgi:mycofactocin precursor